MDTFTNTIEYYNALEGKLSPLGSETIYQKFIHTTGVTDSSYIQLATSKNYLNNLRTGIFAIISIHNIYSSSPQFATAYDTRVGGARVGHGISFNRATNPNTYALDWDGVTAGTDDILIQDVVEEDILYTLINIINVPAPICRLYLNGGLWGSDTDFRDLFETDPLLIDRGKRHTSDASKGYTIGDFGPFFILDLNNVTDTIDADWMDSFSNTISNVSIDYKYNVNRIRKAVYAYDNNIEGVYWKFDSISDFTAYSVKDGSIKEGFTGETSPAGCSEVNI